MACGGGGGEVRTPREMDPKIDVPSEAAILRMEIASLVNLLKENQEIACQKLPRERKSLCPEVKRTVAGRRKKFVAARRVAEKKENMACQESVDLPNSDTQSVCSQVSCISEQMPERCDQKEYDSGKIKPASRFISNCEHLYLPDGGEDEGERLDCIFSYILHQTDSLCDEMASLASILSKISIPVISCYKVSDLFNSAHRLSKISMSIFHYTMNADKQMADQNVEGQRNKEEHVETTVLMMGKGKSSTHCLENQRTNQEVDASVTDLTMGLCESNMETPQMFAYCHDGQMTDEEDEHFVAADPTSGLCDQASAHFYENQSSKEYMEMIDLTTDKCQSSPDTHEGKSSNEGKLSTETRVSRTMNTGKSSTETVVASRTMDEGGESSNEGISSTETRASRTMDEGESSMETHASRMMDEGKSINEGKSSTEAAMMVLDSDEEHEVGGMTMEMRKYLKTLECVEEEEMTPEEVARLDQFRKDILEMEDDFRKIWKLDDKDTPSPISHEDEAEDTEGAEEMEMEDRLFARRRQDWESAWGDRSDFEDITLLSPMHFTHCTPGLLPHTASTLNTLQIYSIKIVETKGKLKWPLFVYGVVAARDTVDHNRNILFSRQRRDCQEVTQADPYLHLTGPSRAIVAMDDVDFEIQLKLRGTTLSRDRALISRYHTYPGDHPEGLDTALFSNSFCTVELRIERLAKSVQATILSVRVVEGPSPFEYGGRIMCSPPQEVNDPRSSRQVVLVDSRDFFRGKMRKGPAGYLGLSRHVVSVERGQDLQFDIQAYSQSGSIARQGRVTFRNKVCNISRGICEIGGSKVEIAVAWSQLIYRKQDILLEGHV